MTIIQDTKNSALDSTRSGFITSKYRWRRQIAQVTVRQDVYQIFNGMWLLESDRILYQ